MRRIRIRTLMILVAVIAVLMGMVGPGWKGYRRWSYHREQAARFGKFEEKERLIARQESARAADREAIRSWLIKTQGFAGKNPRAIDQAVERRVSYHKAQASQSLAAARQWELNRLDNETAARWCLDPYAPEAP